MDAFKNFEGTINNSIVEDFSKAYVMGFSMLISDVNMAMSLLSLCQHSFNGDFDKACRFMDELLEDLHERLLKKVLIDFTTMEDDKIALSMCRDRIQQDFNEIKESILKTAIVLDTKVKKFEKDGA
jgi:hypothetical protein